MPKVLKDLIETIRKAMENRNYKKVFFPLCEILLLLILTTGAIWLIGTGIAQLTHFIKENLGLLICLCLLVYFGTIWIRGKQQQKQDALSEQKRREEIQNELAHQAVGEDSYRVARMAIFTILSNVAKSCNLHQPDSPSCLDAPQHFVMRNGVMLFQFVSVKSGEINIKTINSLIQGRISQMANANELNFQPSTIIVFGQAYPALLVDSVNDVGTYVQINLAFTSENYIKQRIERDHQKRISAFTGGDDDDHDF